MTYHDEENHSKENPDQRPDPRSAPHQGTILHLLLQATGEDNRHDTKDNHEEELDADAAHVDVLSGFHDITPVRVGEHGSSDSLDQEGHDVSADKDLGEPAGGDAEDSFLWEEEVNEACDDHVDECVDPWRSWSAFEGGG